MSEGRRPSTAALTEPAAVRAAIVAAAVLFLVGFLVLPLGIVLVEAFRKGLSGWFSAISEADTLAAISLTSFCVGKQRKRRVFPDL